MTIPIKHYPLAQVVWGREKALDGGRVPTIPT
jgi:hypothetical protein